MQQSYIGWHLFIEGWSSREWETEQQEYYRLLQSRQTGRRWLVGLIKQLWKIAWELWEHRNTPLHHKDNGIRDKAARLLDSRIRCLYSKAYADLRQTRDGYLLAMPLHKLLQKEGLYKMEWIQQVATLLKRFRKTRWRLRAELHSMRLSLRRWLHRSKVSTKRK
jgi:hypothetical protein